jgi:hypothetical protein
VPNTAFPSTAAPISVPEFRHPILIMSSDESDARKLARIMPLAEPNEPLRFALIVKRSGKAHIVRLSHNMCNDHTVSGLNSSSAFLGRQPGITFAWVGLGSSSLPGPTRDREPRRSPSGPPSSSFSITIHWTPAISTRPERKLLTKAARNLNVSNVR